MYFTREELKKLDTKDQKLKDKLNCIIEDEDYVMVFSRADFEINEIQQALADRIYDLEQARKKEVLYFTRYMEDRGITILDDSIYTSKKLIHEINKLLYEGE